MKHMKSIICFLLVLTLFCGCTANKPQKEKTSKTSESATEPSEEASSSTDISETSASSETTSEKSTAESASSAENKTSASSTASKKSGSVRELIDSMSLEEKVGQLFIVCPEALCGNDGYTGLNDISDKDAVTSATKELKNAVRKYHIGGIVMFAKNITSPKQISDFNSGLQEAAEIPLFISVDEEGGTVARLARNSNFSLTKYKSAAAVGASGNPDDAFDMGQTIGSYLKKYGFNMDFAPVADVNSNPDNPVIGNRSFSSDPSTAAKMANAAAKGLRSKGIIPTFKHFPGHGDTAEDSHKSLAVNHHDLDRLMKDDWLPYLNSDLDRSAVMVGHIALPNLTGNMKSAVLDKEIITDYLRGKIGFDGLVITDSMKMQGVTDYYDTGTACIMAINAGCDIILMPQNFIKSYDAVLDAVKNGKISEERLDESIRRIIEYKSEYGIIK